MPRYFRPSKSNFLSMWTDILYLSENQEEDDDGDEMDNYIRKNYSDEVAQLLLDYGEKMMPDYPRMSENPDSMRLHIITMALLSSNPEERLREFLSVDEDSSFPYNYHYLLKLLVFRLANLRDKNGYLIPEFSEPNVVNNILGGGNLKVLAKLAYENLGSFPHRQIQPMAEDVAEEVSKLIDGYLIYWDEVSNSSESKRSICRNIEGQIGINNVRQEYSRFDDFFEKMESFIEDNLEEKIPDFRLDAKLRVMICRFCLEQAMNPIPF